MTDLSEFGGGIDRSESLYGREREERDDDLNGYGFRRDQCIAISQSTGERCGNPISRMGPDNGLCSAHDRAEDVETIEEAETDD